jgi:hypothetical protein
MHTSPADESRSVMWLPLKSCRGHDVLHKFPLAQGLLVAVMTSEP